jgi:hypothetical protein
MSHYLSRQKFLQIATLGTSTILLSTLKTSSQTQQEKPPPIKADLVKEFVIAGHGNLEKTKTLLALEPGLLNACWDWGGGDFETAIEGAGHIGSKDVATFLIGQGARMNIFCAAMLGKIDVVKAILSINPDLKNSKGPHGLQLIHHATKGGEDAKPVLDYLLLIGAK